MDEFRKSAQQGLTLVERAILDLLRANPDGLTNTQVKDALGLESDQDGK